MILPEKYEQTVNKLYDIAGPVIKYRIDTEIYDKKNLILTDYYSNGNKEIDYWLTIHQKDRIHGKDDIFFENVASKLLDFGFSKNDIEFNDLFEYLLADSYWSNNEANQITMYPFFIRAGYQGNKNISLYFRTRIDRILNTINKFGYSFQDKDQARITKYENEFRFITDCLDEPLPTIYDIYAYAYYKNDDTSINKKIETIIQYVLNDDFQRIPEKAYVYDNKRKRYYAAGNVYHACLHEDRKLLNILNRPGFTGDSFT